MKATISSHGQHGISFQPVQGKIPVSVFGNTIHAESFEEMRDFYANYQGSILSFP